MARLGSNQRPSDYESRKKLSDAIQRRRSEYRTSTPMSSKSAVVRQDPSDWQSRDWQSKSWPKIAIAGRGFGPAASLSRTLTSRVLGGPEGSSVPTPNSDLDPEDRRRLGNSIIHATIASVISHYLRIWEVSGSKITCELSAASTRRDLLPAT